MLFLVGSTNAQTALSLYRLEESNVLTFVEVIKCPNVTWIERCGDNFLCTNEDQGSITSLKVIRTEHGWSLKVNHCSPCGGSGTTHLTAHNDSDGGIIRIFAANYCSGSLSVLSSHSADASFDLRQIIEHGPADGSTAHAHQCLVDSTRHCLHVCDLGMDTVYTYSLSDPLLLLGELKLHPGSGPRHVVLSACNRWAYIVCELSNQVVVAGIDATTGCLVSRNDNTYSTLPADADGAEMGASEILLSSDGRYLYISNRDIRPARSVTCDAPVASAVVAERSSIGVFRVDPNSGEAALIQCVPSQGRHPRHMCLCREGALLLVANRDSQNFVAFPVDVATGLLGVGAVVSSSLPHCRDPGFLLQVSVAE